MHGKNNFHFESTELCFVIHYLPSLHAIYYQIFLSKLNLFSGQQIVSVILESGRNLKSPIANFYK